MGSTTTTRRHLARFAALPLLAASLAASLAGCVGTAYPYQQPGYAEPGRYSIPADVLFAFDSATLRPQAYDSLQRTLGQIRAAIPYPAIRVEGNTDSVGSDAYNDQLSLRRAQAVAQWLTGQGIPPAAITEVGNGKRRPVAPNDSPDGRAQNRRVDLVARPA